MKPVSKLIEGQRYILRTLDENGFEKESKYWIKVLWDGKNLDDGNGCYWNEWLKPDLSDIFQEETF